MTKAVTIYVSPPATNRAPWRVVTHDRPGREFDTEAEAMAAATQYARMSEAAGGTAIVKVESQDGSWGVQKKR
jgi:hypothetical protein